MKLYELNRGDRFKSVRPSHDENDELPVLKVRGTFLGRDGMYGKVLLDGFEETQCFLANIEGERIE